MNVSIFGLGYVGCISLGCLAQDGHTCVGVDVLPSKVDFINQGKPTVIEKDIDGIIREQHRAGRIQATIDSTRAVLNSAVSIVCVGTPSTGNGHLNLQAIYRVAEQIGQGIKEKDSDHVVVIRSTVLPGTNAKVRDIIAAVSGKTHGRHFVVVSNPEFLREGSAVQDFYQPPYTLIGTDVPAAVEPLRELYRKVDAPLMITDIATAELIKYVNNAFHAFKITFANEVGNICKKIGVDSHRLMEIFCMDRKLNISPCYLKPGFAYGGSCLPKDMKALKTIAHDHYLECPVLESIERSNECQKRIVLDQLIELQKQRIGFLGLSFKSGTDDLRYSPILDVIEILLGKGFDIRIYDRNVHLSRLVGANREYILKKIPLVSRFLVNDLSEILGHSEVIVLVNREREFEPFLSTVPANTLIYDLCNLNFKERSTHQNYIGLAW
jgi:GDP-mannose 6-dehydrogenase